jgi:hypothetical protein
MPKILGNHFGRKHACKVFVGRVTPAGDADIRMVPFVAASAMRQLNQSAAIHKDTSNDFHVRRNSSAGHYRRPVRQYFTRMRACFGIACHTRRARRYERCQLATETFHLGSVRVMNGNPDRGRAGTCAIRSAKHFELTSF